MNGVRCRHTGWDPLIRAAEAVADRNLPHTIANAHPG